MGRKKIELPELYAVANFQNWSLAQRQAINARRMELNDQLWFAAPKSARRIAHSPFLLDSIIERGGGEVCYDPDTKWLGYQNLEQLEAEIKKLKQAWHDIIKVSIKRVSGCLLVKFKVVRPPRKRKIAPCASI